MAGASIPRSISYPSLDQDQNGFQENVELAYLMSDDLDSEVVDKMPLRSSSNDGDLRNFPGVAKPGGTLRNENSGGAFCCRRFQGILGSRFGQPMAYICPRRLKCREVIGGSKICWLLPAVAVSLILKPLNVPQAYVFAASLIGIAPLAERLGFVTERLAVHTGPTVGGLLNATFGNATEMIISLFALKNGLIRVVQLSLLGSILSNMLLVLGCAFYSGGLVYKNQKFNKAAAVVNSGLLLMAVMGLLFPAVLHSTHTEVLEGKSELYLSRFSSCVMLVAYASYLYFQLKSHRQLYDNLNEDEEEDEEGSDITEEVDLCIWVALFWMAVLTVFISLLSNYLVDAIEGASNSLYIPLSFISVIILPIVGNAAEHASAIMFALKDKLDLSLGVAIGSSTQISMFLIPFCVVVGWMMGKPMDLDFKLFETATLFITVIVVAFMLQEGSSNYFKGLMLMLCYLIVAASFFVHKFESHGDNDGKGDE